MKLFQCPNPSCQYLIPEIERNNAIMDFLCPHCGKTIISYFNESKKFNHHTTANVRFGLKTILSQISKLTSYIRRHCVKVKNTRGLKMKCKICNNDLEIKTKIKWISDGNYKYESDEYKFHYCKSCGIMYFLPWHNTD